MVHFLIIIEINKKQKFDFGWFWVECDVFLWGKHDCVQIHSSTLLGEFRFHHKKHNNSQSSVIHQSSIKLRLHQITIHWIGFHSVSF